STGPRRHQRATGGQQRPCRARPQDQYRSRRAPPVPQSKRHAQSWPSKTCQSKYSFVPVLSQHGQALMQIVEDVIDRALGLLPEAVRDTNQSPAIQPVLLGKIVKAACVLVPRRLQLRDRLLVFEEDHFHLLECSLVPLNIRVTHTLLVRYPALH